MNLATSLNKLRFNDFARTLLAMLVQRAGINP